MSGVTNLSKLLSLVHNMNGTALNTMAGSLNKGSLESYLTVLIHHHSLKSSIYCLNLELKCDKKCLDF